MEPSVVIFAIQAGIRLGRKLNAVLVDDTRERAMVLPLGNLYGDVVKNDALDYFREYPELTAESGPYFGLNQEEKIDAYRTLRVIEDRIGDTGGVAGEAREIVIRLQKFEHIKAGYGARPAVQRVLGQIVEIAIDYFIARPELLQGDTPSSKILSAFIANIDTVEFSDSTPRSMLSDVLLAALRTLDANMNLVDDDIRLQTLVGGITQSLIEDYSTLSSQGEQVRREQLIRRIASSVLRGGAAAFVERSDLFLPKDTAAEKLVRTTLSQIITGISGKEDLFTGDALEFIFNSALQAVAENPALFTDQIILQQFIGKTLTALTDTQAKAVFADDLVAPILQGALETLGSRADALIDTHDPRQQLLADTVAVLSTSLAAELGGGGTMADRFSRKQIIALTRLVFREVGRYPERLLGDGPIDERRTALAQIIGAVAQGLSEAPHGNSGGEGLLEIMETALAVAVRNADKLLDLGTADPRKNLLYEALNQIVVGVLEGGDVRQLVTLETFKEMVVRLLPVVSANAGILAPEGARQVLLTVKAALTLSGSSLESRVNSVNLPVLVEGLLHAVLWSELDLHDKEAVEASARSILKAAAQPISQRSIAS
jgi:hypothetical protein